MTLAENTAARRRGDGIATPSPEPRSFMRLERAPTLRIPTPSKPAVSFVTDRVRAKPAISPTLSMNIGMTAIGLGVWGALFPNHVKKVLGVKAPASVVQAVFGARELWSGYSLAGDPTRTGVLWSRVAGDVFDILALRALDNPGNAKRATARAALGFVLAVTALDLVTAVRMTGVKRNCE